MKIVTITTIKNEADIIESFIRYHLNIVDEMIILNNGSTDDTNDILENLLAEDLPLIILNDTDKYFEPMEKYNFLLKKAVNEYGADIICPLDVDEFITCDDGNPREIIERIPPFTFYKIKWKTYVPYKTDDFKKKFIPSRITHIRDETIETFFKVILTRDLSYHYNVRLTTGNHNLRFQKRFENDIHCEECNNLKIAHFPLRSVEQMTSKVLVSYPNTLSRKNVNPNMSHHYPLMFNKILETGYIEIEDVTEFAKQYSLEENKGKSELEHIEIKITEDPMNLNFCKDINIKYDFKLNPLNNVLKNYVYFATEIHKFKQSIEDSKSNFLNKINEMTLEKNEIQIKFQKNMIKLGDKDKKIRILKNEIENLKKNNEDLETKIDYISNELNNKNNEIKRLSKDNVNINNNYEIKVTLDKFSSDLNNKNNEIKLLNKKIEDLKMHNYENTQSIVDLNKKLCEISSLLDKKMISD